MIAETEPFGRAASRRERARLYRAIGCILSIAKPWILVSVFLRDGRELAAARVEQLVR